MLSKFIPPAIRMLAVWTLSCGSIHAQELPKLNIEGSGITVSGLSSGGYMAVQLHVAHSLTFSGVGVIAGGPYHCAASTLWLNTWTATNHCMDFDDWITFWGPPNAAYAVTSAVREATAKRIDPLVGLKNDRAYLFSGSRDTRVPTSVMDSLRDFYQALMDETGIQTRQDVAAGHAMITENFGTTECASSRPPYINDCDFDLAGEMLNHLYGTLQPPVEQIETNLAEFDQRPYTNGAVGMNALGHVYVPAACAAGEACRLHVALHGCRQYQEAIGDAFYGHAGFNRWAEANHMVVLYPQAAPYTYGWFSWPNPNGCWDWWGYSSSDFHVQAAP
uniref:extracellular catalytic domain type 2 short-chain-length polyhydroxyalkanoate depolymerase n=1 Tax=Sedimenticola sp. TaxID=1940285 RepID=UPI003D14A79E